MGSVDLTRRALFRPASLKHLPLRPPWGGSEQLFTDLCSRCGDCIDACPTKIIKVGSGGFPEVDFSIAGCTFCGDCVSACATGALQQQPHVSGWPYRARVKSECLAQQGVFCRSCADLCEQNAIRFSLQLAGKARPDIDLEACNGCGACVAPCPVNAIVIEDSKADG